MTRVLVAVKRVVDASSELVLRDDRQGLDGRWSGHTTGDHDSCAVELGIRVAEATDGSVTVVSVGPSEAIEQVRSALALGARAGVLVEADPVALGPADVAAELAAVVRDAEASGEPFDLVLLGNDAADTGDFQVPIRLAYAVDRPVVTGAAVVEVVDGRLHARATRPHGEESYDVALPAVVSVLEGGVEPRYPTLRGRMAATKVEVETRQPVSEPAGSGRVRWHLPEAPPATSEVLGEGPETAPAVVDLFERLGVLR
jgi:electron transfer flavoprotein beta subunit